MDQNTEVRKSMQIQYTVKVSISTSGEKRIFDYDINTTEHHLKTVSLSHNIHQNKFPTCKMWWEKKGGGSFNLEAGKAFWVMPKNPQIF